MGGEGGRVWAVVGGLLAVAAGAGYGLGLLAGGGHPVNGLIGLLVAFLLAVAWVGRAYWGGERIVLRVVGARPVGANEEPGLHNIVSGVADLAGVARPKVHLVDAETANALTVGRDPGRACLVVTRGLLDRINRVELEGVIAHELVHLRERDTPAGTLLSGLFGPLVAAAERPLMEAAPAPGGAAATAGWLARGPATAMGWLIRLTLAPEREARADARGVELTRYPPALASALAKVVDARSPAAPAPGGAAAAHLWLDQPVPVGESRLAAFERRFQTHPPMQDRIAYLREL